MFTGAQHHVIAAKLQPTFVCQVNYDMNPNGTRYDQDKGNGHSFHKVNWGDNMK